MKETEQITDNTLHFTCYFAGNQAKVNIREDILLHQQKNAIKQAISVDCEELDVSAIFEHLDNLENELSYKERQIQGQEHKLALLSLITGGSSMILTMMGLVSFLETIPGHHPNLNLALVPIMILFPIVAGYFWSNLIFHVWQKKNRFLNRIRGSKEKTSQELSDFKQAHCL
jgi:hypothetical protein